MGRRDCSNHLGFAGPRIVLPDAVVFIVGCCVAGSSRRLGNYGAAWLGMIFGNIGSYPARSPAACSRSVVRRAHRRTFPQDVSADGHWPKRITMPKWIHATRVGPFLIKSQHRSWTAGGLKTNIASSSRLRMLLASKKSISLFDRKSRPPAKPEEHLSQVLTFRSLRDICVLHDCETL
jgi:hypothetical protein